MGVSERDHCQPHAGQLRATPVSFSRHSSFFPFDCNGAITSPPSRRAGNFPLRLAPEQVRVITIGDAAPLLACAKAIADELRANFVRTEP